MKHNIVYEGDQPTTATVFYKGRAYVAAPGHPHFPAIIQALYEGQKSPEDVVGLFDTSSALAKGLKTARRLVASLVLGRDLRHVAEKIRVTDNGNVIFDGKQVHGAVSDTVASYYFEGHEDFLPLVQFMAKVLDNPNEHSRESLYEWMQHLSFNIADDGDILAYKSVDYRNDKYRSISQGFGYVNGEKVSGNLDNAPGNIVSMDRDDVTHDPSQGCSTGLHVGTVDYARTFAGNALIEVKIDPRDVVSVPTEDAASKMRVCRYEVVRDVTSKALNTLGSYTAPGAMV